MLKVKNVQMIDVSDWDNLVEKTYGRIYNFQQQDGCKERGTFSLTVPSHAYDYENAITDDTALLMKIHTSNFKIMGFTSEASLEELVELGRETGLPVIYDQGSGLMVNLQQYGVDEPNVPDCLKTGIDKFTHQIQPRCLP